MKFNEFSSCFNISALLFSFFSSFVMEDISPLIKLDLPQQMIMAYLTRLAK